MGAIHPSLCSLAKTSFSLRDSANVVIADLNEEKGSRLVEEVRKESKNPKYVPGLFVLGDGRDGAADGYPTQSPLRTLRRGVVRCPAAALPRRARAAARRHPQHRRRQRGRRGDVRRDEGALARERGPAGAGHDDDRRQRQGRDLHQSAGAAPFPAQPAGDGPPPPPGRVDGVARGHVRGRGHVRDQQARGAGLVPVAAAVPGRAQQGRAHQPHLSVLRRDAHHPDHGPRDAGGHGAGHDRGRRRGRSALSVGAARARTGARGHAAEGGRHQRDRRDGGEGAGTVLEQGHPCARGREPRQELCAVCRRLSAAAGVCVAGGRAGRGRRRVLDAVYIAGNLHSAIQTQRLLSEFSASDSASRTARFATVFSIPLSAAAEI